MARRLFASLPLSSSSSSYPSCSAARPACSRATCAVRRRWTKSSSSKSLPATFTISTEDASLLFTGKTAFRSPSTLCLNIYWTRLSLSRILVFTSTTDSTCERLCARSWADVRRMLGHDGFLQGGSTITQQLAKNAFLTHERTLTRKLQELLWAIQIERKYSKAEILETYLNEIYLGPGVYGVEAAARYYFNKSVDELTLAESALLAGLAQNAGLHSPYRNPEGAQRRRNTVLSRMEELGMITAADAAAAKAEPLAVTDSRPARNLAPTFVNYVINQLLELDGIDVNTIYAGGIHVYTTLDLDMQRAADEAMERAFSNPAGLLARATTTDANGLEQPQASLIALDPRTGHIKAMVGGRSNDHFNRAVQATRLPGSAIKPFIYTAAIDTGLTPATVIVDEPFEWEDPFTGDVWRPRNFGNRFYGEMTLREALEQSINIIAVKLMAEHVTPRQVIDYARNMGISTLVTEGGATTRCSRWLSAV